MRTVLGKPAVAATPVSSPTRLMVLVLARQEAIRLLLHPVSIAGRVLYTLFATGNVLGPADPSRTFGSIDTTPTMVPGLFALLAASLLASPDHRGRSDELLAPLAACAALLRVAHRPTPVLVAAATSSAVTAVGAVGQLP